MVKLNGSELAEIICSIMCNFDELDEATTIEELANFLESNSKDISFTIDG